MALRPDGGEEDPLSLGGGLLAATGARRRPLAVTWALARDDCGQQHPYPRERRHTVSERSEEELVVWLREQIEAFDAGTIDADLVAHLDEEIPGWNDLGARARVAPVPEDDADRSAWVALHIDAHDAGELSAEQSARIDELVPDWNSESSRAALGKAPAAAPTAASEVEPETQPDAVEQGDAE